VLAGSIKKYKPTTIATKMTIIVGKIYLPNLFSRMGVN
jgi:hypothetical protein